MAAILFGSWKEVLRIALAALVGYAVLLTLLRSFGKRAIAKMNISDFVVTVAIGSTLGGFTMSRDIPLVDGVAALSILVAIQFLVMVSTQWEPVRKAIEGEPTLLVYQGRILWKMLARERVSESEVEQAVRSEGISSLDEVLAVILEVDGEYSVVRRGRGNRDLLAGAVGAPEDLRARRRPG